MKQSINRGYLLVTLLASCLILITLPLTAQAPSARKAKLEAAAKKGAPALSVRAQTQYKGELTMPEDVVWLREIYRTVNLKEANNGALYYPIEPIGDRMNLFTLLFKLIAENKIDAYEYRLDGMDVFTEENKLKFKDLLDRFRIIYKEKIAGGQTTYEVDNSDVPSGEVISYFVKEAYYFDQRSSMYNTKVVALCPVLHREGDFSMDITKYPMFWIDYKDIAPYVSQIHIMSSNLNNVAKTSINDYFITKQYKGAIYKTTNMLNQTLAQYAPDSIPQEQKRIETELANFEKNLWESTRIKPILPIDSTEVVVKGKKTKATKTDTTTKKSIRTSGSTSKASTKSASTSSAKAPKAPKASVRRVRK